jgi:WD40 repeat protein
MKPADKLMALIWSLALAVGLSPAAQAPPKPLSEMDVLKFIELQTPDETIMARIQHEGIGFPADAASSDRLRKAGASPAILTALHNADPAGKAGRALKLTRFPTPNEVRAVAITRDGKSLASGGEEQTIRLWDATGERDHAEHLKKVSALAFSPDGKTLASGSIQGDIVLWNVEGGQSLKRKSTLKTPKDAPVVLLSIGPDGDTLAAVHKDEGKIDLWSVRQDKIVKSLSAPAPVTQVVFASDGKTIASVSEGSGVYLWSPDGTQIAKCKDSEHISCVAFSPRNNTLAGGGNKSVSIWSVKDHEDLADKTTEELISSLVYTADGKALLLLGKDGRVRLYKVEENQVELKSVPSFYLWVGDGSQEFTRPTANFAFTPDGRFLVLGMDKEIVRWDLSTALPRGD